jgi:hypothetical protein
MVAIYPTSVKNFTDKNDFTDIVNAGDVNVAYDEIEAVEKTVGTLPNTDTIDNVVNTWPTVRDRITAVRRGVSNPYCNVVWNNGGILSTVLTNIVPFTGKTWDTHGMWSGGTTLVCPRDGVYTFSYTVHWYDPVAAPINFTSGGYVKSWVSITGQTHPFMGVNQYFPAGWNQRVEQTASYTMPWNKGSSIFLALSEDVIATIPVYASLSVLFERDPQTSSNL